MSDLDPNNTPPFDVAKMADRIDALESRLMFQDETIETLNKTITAQWQQIDKLARQMGNLSERLQEAETHMPGAASERPPHY